MSYQVIVDDEAAFDAFDEIIKRWKASPKLFPYDQKGAVIPQTVIPAWIRNDRELLCNFYFYICLYMRGGIESLQAFKAIVTLVTDKPELLDPLYAQHLDQEELRSIIASYIGWDAKAVARFWIENSKRLVRNWDGRASLIFRRLHSYEEALRRVKNKRMKQEWRHASRVDDRGEGFMGFQPKMVSMLLYFVDWEGLLEKSFTYPTPADFHNFRFGLALRIMLLRPQPEHLRSTEQLSKPWRDLTIRSPSTKVSSWTWVTRIASIPLVNSLLVSTRPLTTTIKKGYTQRSYNHPGCLKSSMRYHY